MNTNISFQHIINLSRKIASVLEKEYFDPLDVLIAFLYNDKEWKLSDFSLKNVSGLSIEYYPERKKIIDGLKSFDNSDVKLKNEIQFRDAAIQKELLGYKKRIEDESIPEEYVCIEMAIRILTISFDLNEKLVFLLGFDEDLFAKSKTYWENSKRVMVLNSIDRNMTNIQNRINNNIVGQENIVNRLVEGFVYYNNRIDIEPVQVKRKPQSIFILGGHGSGKSLLIQSFVNAINEVSVESDEPWKYMYVDASMLGNIYGSNLVSFLNDNYFKILKANRKVIFVFDEVYSACKDFFSIMKRVLGDGLLEYGSDFYDFSSSILVFLTSQGQDIYNLYFNGVFKDTEDLAREVIMEKLKDHEHSLFGKERVKLENSFLDRIDDYIVLNNFGFNSRRQLVSKLFESELGYFNNAYGVSRSEFSDEAIDLLVYSSIHLKSPRKVQKHIRDSFIAPLEKEIISVMMKGGAPEKIALQLEQSGCIEQYLTDVGINRGDNFLLIDDNKVYHESLKFLGFTNFLYASSVSSAKEIIAKKGLKNISWIMLDLVFPDGEANGFDFLKEFRRKHRNFPIYIFSTEIRTKKEFLELSRAGGAAGFIEKRPQLVVKRNTKRMNDELSTFRQRIEEICVETSFQKQLIEIDRNKESLNCIYREKYDPKNNLLLTSIIDFRSEPILLFYNSTNEIVYPNCSFDDIKGQDNLVREIRNWLLKIKRNNLSKTDFGIVLHGPPGTGKTLVAKAIANEIDAYFIPTSPGNLKGKYVGESEEAVRNLFDDARRNKPSVIFIDEIETIGDRSKFSGDRAWEASFVNTFLSEMDGFMENEEVFVIGATNHLDRIDPALIRPGRLGKHILVPLPSEESQVLDVLELYLGKAWMKVNISKASLSQIGKVIIGMSPAEIMYMVEMAQDISVQENRDVLDSSSLSKAREELFLGKISSENHDPETLRLVACHEAGHAIVSKELGRDIYQVTVQKRENEKQFLGFVESINMKKTKNREDLIHEIAICLAGREAEGIVYGKYFDGASSDISKAIEYAKRILYLGMNESGLPEILSPEGTDELLEKQTKERVNEILSEAQSICKEILSLERSKLETMMDRLIVEKTIFFT